MKAILLKDYLEQRMYFVIILAVAALSLLAAAFFGQLDSGVALVILFILQGPLFIYLAANHQISSEVNNGTWRFLTALPVSRLRLWAAKLIFTAIYTTSLYAIYLVMAIAAGVDAGELWRLISGNPGLVIGVPVTIVAYGFFTTMLPSGFSTISTLIIAPVLYAVFRAEATLLNLNFVMATGLATAIMLGLSLLTFLGDRTMSSPWRGVKGIAMLLAGIMLSLVGWSALNSAADHFWRIDVKESAEWLPMNDGKTIVWRVYSKTPFWDVIQPRIVRDYFYEGRVFGDGDYLFKEASHSGRVLLHDTALGLVKSVGSRHSNVFKDSHNSGLVLAQIPEIRFGLLRGPRYAVIDSEGNILKILTDGIDEYTRDLKLIDDRRFIYAEEIKSGNNSITQFTLFEKSVGEKVVFTAGEDFGFSEYVLVPDEDRSKPVKVYIAGASDHEKGKTLLVSVPDGKKTVLPNSPASDILCAGPEFMVVDNGRWNKELDRPMNDLQVLYFDGRIKPLNCIASNSKIVGISAANRIVAKIAGKDELDWYSPGTESIVEVDPETMSTREILRFPYPGSVKMRISRTGEHAFIYYGDATATPVRRQLFAANLKDGTVKEFTELNAQSLNNSQVHGFTLFNGPHALSGNRFMIEGETSAVEGGIYELDTENVSVTRKMDYQSIEAVFKKWGADL
ncbi:MAG TPA: hypothetical protein PLK28_14820 [Candidatus Rifleibacterium sp.]|nr:hypothetical protein [Candidatus Rifleibacterium sp.]